MAKARVRESTVLAVAAFGGFLAFLDATVVNVAFPSIRESFPGTSVGDLSWVLNSYNIVFAAFLVVCGRTADLLGRRRVFVLGVVVFTAASLLCAVAGSVGFLVAARALQALGAAMLVPASLAVVIEAFPAHRRAHAIGLWGASAAVAAGLGPPIGGALVEAGGWRWAFLVNLPFGVAAVVAARSRLVESRSPGRRRLPDLRGALLLAVALALLTTGIITGDDWGWTSWSVVASFVGAGLASAGFVASSRAHRSPVLDPLLLRVRGFVVANLASVVGGIGFYAYLLNNVLWLQYLWDYSVLQSGLALVPGAVVAAVVAAVLGPVAETLGYRRVVVPGALVWASAYVWYAVVVEPRPEFLSQWLPGQVLSGIGVGATFPVLGSAALAAVPGGGFATASAVGASARQLGGVLGVALLVVVIGTPTPATAESALRGGWVFCAACFVVCALVSAAMGPVRTRVDVDSSTTSPTRTDKGRQADSVGLALPPGAPTPRRPSVAASGEDGAWPAAAPLMARLPAPARRALEASAERVELAAGEPLFFAGDLADAAYAVVTGRVEVSMDGAVVRVLGPGAVLGELALLTGEPRSATVRARRDTSLLRLRRDAFEAVLEREPGAARAVAAVMAGQLADRSPPADVRRRAQPTTVGVVGLHRGAPVAQVTEVLVALLRRHLTAAAPGHVSPEGLERAERTNDRVVLTAEDPDEAAEWWRWCVRQADHVVLVASADRSLDEARPAVPSGTDLLLVGGAVDDPTRAAWAGALDAWQVTAVEAVSAVALRALAARVGGQSVGVVLAGGGARAFAHLGVLAELEDAGIAVDRIAGCSVGAIVAAMHAGGHDAATAHEICYAEFVRRRPFSDYTLPTKAVARGRRREIGFERVFGHRPIEALPRQFRCVSTDLLTRDTFVHRQGDLVTALMATSALPGLFPPVRLDGRLLVDGGVLANLPVQALVERDEGPVVAVNIGTGAPARAEVPRGEPARPPRIPALGETLLRTMLIGSAGAVTAATELGAVVVTPPTLGVGLLEFHQLDRMVEAGRAAGRVLLEQTGGTLLAPAHDRPAGPG